MIDKLRALSVRIPPWIIRDSMLMLAVAGGLAAVHFLVPEYIQVDLAFDHTRFAGYTLFTSAYVHASNSHLFENLFGYGIAVAIAYTLCTRQGRRRWFWRTMVLFLVVLPVLVNLTSYGVFEWFGSIGVSRGFSGVVAGFAGFVLVALTRGLFRRHGQTVGWNVGVGVLLLLLGEVAIIYTGVPSLLLSGLLIVGIVLTFGEIGWIGYQQEWDTEAWRVLAVESLFVVTVVLLLAIFVWMLFPATLVNDGTITNIIGHGAGFAWGALISIMSGQNPF